MKLYKQTYVVGSPTDGSATINDHDHGILKSEMHLIPRRQNWTKIEGCGRNDMVASFITFLMASSMNDDFGFV